MMNVSLIQLIAAERRKNCLNVFLCVCVCGVKEGDVMGGWGGGVSVCVCVCLCLLTCLGICSLSAGCLGLMHTWRAT